MARSQVVISISPTGMHTGGRTNQALGVSSTGDVVVEIDNVKVHDMSTLKQALAQVVFHYSAGSELSK